MVEFALDIKSPEHLANVCGPFDQHLKLIEKTLAVEIYNRGSRFQIKGSNQNKAKTLLAKLSALMGDKQLDEAAIEMLIKQIDNDILTTQPMQIKLKHKTIQVNSRNQQRYIKEIDKQDCVFAIGPAGTGKTYLAVAKAVEALECSAVRRLILVRPAVEAGEKLGFLPGDVSEKFDPYLRPAYDALYEMLGERTAVKYLENRLIEIAPLAFMRGRTLNESFIILDEAQNTTNGQMKMFLTRLGFGSKMIITGDITQIDLDQSIPSGLVRAIDILAKQSGLSFCYFDNKDIIRHRLVQAIVKAYAVHE